MPRFYVVTLVSTVLLAACSKEQPPAPHAPSSAPAASSVAAPPPPRPALAATVTLDPITVNPSGQIVVAGSTNLPEETSLFISAKEPSDFALPYEPEGDVSVQKGRFGPVAMVGPEDRTPNGFYEIKVEISEELVGPGQSTIVAKTLMPIGAKDKAEAVSFERAKKTQAKIKAIWATLDGLEKKGRASERGLNTPCMTRFRADEAALKRTEKDIEAIPDRLPAVGDLKGARSALTQCISCDYSAVRSCDLGREYLHKAAASLAAAKLK